MQKLKSLIVIPLLCLSALACNALLPLPGSNSASTQVSDPPADFIPPLTEAEVPRVSLEEAKAAFDDGTAVIVDVRSKDAFKTSHIPGALNIQLGEFETDPGGTGLPIDKWIITYCT